MAVLSDSDRKRIEAGYQRHYSRIGEEMPYSSDELRLAINATDDWIESNQAGFNAALTGDFGSGATAAQKTFLFMGVAAMRVSLEFVKKVLGEVD